MNVAVDVLGSVEEPFLHVRQEHVLEMSLRPGWMKLGPRLGVLNSVRFGTGEIGLFPCHLERWVGSADYKRLKLGISHAALMAASDGMACEFELRPKCKLEDARLVV